jgi:phage terminase Nu1 subunit (DNA packaging protein)
MTMGVRQMARALGRSPTLISRYKREGMPMESEAAATGWMLANVRPDPRTRHEAPPHRHLNDGPRLDAPAAPPDYHSARARREQAEAETAELKLRELRGELVRVDKIQSAHQRKVSAMREAFLQLPSRIVPLLLADSSPEAVDAVLKREISAALRQVSGVE